MMRLAVFAIAFGTLLIGVWIGGTTSGGKDAVVERYLSWSKQDQRDFVLAAVTHDPMLRATIAEDWCGQNKRTQQVCWNARYMK